MSHSKAIKAGRWAIVTGGSDGLGLAFATDLARRGMHCLLVARRQAVLDSAAETIRAMGVEARTLSLDLGAPDAIERIDSAAAGLPVSLVIFNAGAEASGENFIDAPVAQWRGLIERNIIFLTEALHHFARKLVAAGGGGIIVVGSEAAFGGVARSALYTATKGYALNLCESLWAELAPLGVDVTTLLFKIADTPLLRATLARKNIPVEATGASDTAALAHATVEALGTGPVYNADEESPTDGLTSNAARKARVIAKSDLMKMFYG